MRLNGSGNDPDFMAALQRIQAYRNAVKWIESQLVSRPASRTDDTRFYVEVIAI